MYTQTVAELQDLVANPVEREWVELKSWVDLKDKSAPGRASTARHLAALSNYGGGYLIFGLNDDGTRGAPLPDARSLYSHDVIAGIVDRYLQPKFQCIVSFVSHGGVEHPVVWVPPHGASPVISKADGPQDSKGHPQGIRSGSVYMRTPKPESVPVTTPEHWDKLIQRCVIARRDELVGMFSSIVAGGSPEKRELAGDRENLEAWHRSTQNAAIAELERLKLRMRFPMEENFMQFSYMIRHTDASLLVPADAMRTIEKVNTAVKDTVRYGWSMFYPFSRREVSPQFLTDPNVDNGDRDFLQTSLLEEGSTKHGDFWRITLDGRASIFRNFHEDRFPNAPDDVAEGEKWFDPWLHVREVTEVVRHARAMAEEFAGAERICFLFEWKGLKGRTLASGNPERYWSTNPVAQANQRAVYNCFPAAEVIGNLPSVVSSLYGPVHRIFDPRFNVTPEWIAALLKAFIVPGL